MEVSASRSPRVPELYGGRQTCAAAAALSGNKKKKKKTLQTVCSGQGETQQENPPHGALTQPDRNEPGRIKKKNLMVTFIDPSVRATLRARRVHYRRADLGVTEGSW